MDESRKQFEEWRIANNEFANMAILSNGEYAEVTTNCAWHAWVASRSAVEIELPPAVDGSNVPFAGNAWNAYRVEAVEAIRAAGIKVKE